MANLNDLKIFQHLWDSLRGKDPPSCSFLPAIKKRTVHTGPSRTTIKGESKLDLQSLLISPILRRYSPSFRCSLLERNHVVAQGTCARSQNHFFGMISGEATVVVANVWEMHTSHIAQRPRRQEVLSTERLHSFRNIAICHRVFMMIPYRISRFSLFSALFLSAVAVSNIPNDDHT